MKFSGSLGVGADLCALVLRYDFDTMELAGHRNGPPAFETRLHVAASGSAGKLRNHSPDAVRCLACRGHRADPDPRHRPDRARCLLAALFGLARFEILRISGLYGIEAVPLSWPQRRGPGFGEYVRSVGRALSNGRMWAAVG